MTKDSCTFCGKVCKPRQYKGRTVTMCNACWKQWEKMFQ